MFWGFFFAVFWWRLLEQTNQARFYVSLLLLFHPNHGVVPTIVGTRDQWLIHLKLGSRDQLVTNQGTSGYYCIHEMVTKLDYWWVSLVSPIESRTGVDPLHRWWNVLAWKAIVGWVSHAAHTRLHFLTICHQRWRSMTSCAIHLELNNSTNLT